MNLYYIKCSNFTKNKQIKIKCKVNGKNKIKKEIDKIF